MDSLPIKRRSILVVDDDETVRLLSREALERTGYRVLVANDGSDVPETVSSERVDLVLLDLEMPGADGLSVCRELRANQETARTPIIIVTSHDDVDSIAAAYEAGATDFVTKPVNWLILGQRVSYVLGASDHRREVEAHREALAEAQRIARLGSWNLDPDTGIMVGSPEFYRVYQLRGREEGVSLAAFLERIHPDDRDQVRAHLQALEDSTQPFTLDHRLHVEDGDERVVHFQGSPRVDPQGDVHCWAGVAQDVTERKRAEEQIRFLAFHDSLTGLGNQRLFRQRLLQGVEGARRHRRTLALLFVDLDHFKRINDTLGHSIGDDLLQSAAGRLEAAVRSTDCVARLADEEFAAPVARFGGDEFTILLTELAEAQDAARVARRVLELMRRPFLGGSQEVTVGASIGIAVWPFDGETADEVIRNADAAMYHAKELGGNNYQFYSAELNADAVERLRIESALRSALGSEGLQIHYQPRVDMRTRRIQSFEALARWHDAESGSIPPGRFIPIAEEAGLIGALGEWVLRQACAQARAWHESGHEGLGVSVNLSPRQFVGGELLDSVERILRETGLEPRFLELEITETALLHDEDGAADLLNRLSKQGVRIALDDFGTGYSSMSYLRRFPVRTLKIDRSFVDGIDKNPADAALTAAILSMAKELGLEVVAEGVETELQRAFLAERGCDQEQGFLFSPPVPAADCTELLCRERKG